MNELASTSPVESPDKPEPMQGRDCSENAGIHGHTRGVAALPVEVKDAIRAHAAEDFPNEACGVIIRVGRKQKIMRCRNLSEDPQNYFRMSGEDLATAEDYGDVVAYYHSHPNRPPVPSDGDRTESERHMLPCFIVGWPSDAWDYYMPSGWKAELEGRPFFYGILDCYALVRDYFADQLKIELADFARPDENKLDVREFIGERSGFYRVYDGMSKNDVLLIQVQSDKPNHCAIYMGDGEILHHVRGRLSCRQPYLLDSGYYGKNTYCVVRHESSMKR